MKKSIQTIVFVLGFVFSLSASNNPAEKVTIIDATFATVSMDMAVSSFFTSADYNEKSSSFEFRSNSDISFVQIYNEAGDMEFQLPVMASKVKIKKNFFSSGNYRLGFIIKGNTNVLYTDLKVN